MIAVLNFFGNVFSSIVAWFPKHPVGSLCILAVFLVAIMDYIIFALIYKEDACSYNSDGMSKFILIGIASTIIRFVVAEAGIICFASSLGSILYDAIPFIVCVFLSVVMLIIVILLRNYVARLYQYRTYHRINSREHTFTDCLEFMFIESLAIWMDYKDELLGFRPIEEWDDQKRWEERHKGGKAA